MNFPKKNLLLKIKNYSVESQVSNNVNFALNCNT
jgi:hypothetical protein